MAKEKRCVLMVGHLLQYHPVFVKLKELERSGELGRINYIYSHRLNLGKIRREENILWSFAPHDISMILVLGRRGTGSVHGDRRKLSTSENCRRHHHASGVSVRAASPHFRFLAAPFQGTKLVVVGDRKMAVFDDTQPWQDKLLLYPHKINWQNNMPVPDQRLNRNGSTFHQDEPLKCECLHFLECMQNGQRPTTDGHEGLSVLKFSRQVNCRSIKMAARSI